MSWVFIVALLCFLIFFGTAMNLGWFTIALDWIFDLLKYKPTPKRQMTMRIQPSSEARGISISKAKNAAPIKNFFSKATGNNEMTFKRKDTKSPLLGTIPLQEQPSQRVKKLRLQPIFPVSTENKEKYVPSGFVFGTPVDVPKGENGYSCKNAAQQAKPTTN